MRNPQPLPPLATPPVKVTAKEAHRRIRELTEAVSSGKRLTAYSQERTEQPAPTPSAEPIPEP